MLMRKPVSAPAIALLVVLLTSCGKEEPQPVELQLEDLVRFSENYDERRVVTSGVVRSFSEPGHHWIEDERLNRVEVQPGSAVSSLVGETVRVVGRFHHSPGRGRSIEAESTAVIAD